MKILNFLILFLTMFSIKNRSEYDLIKTKWISYRLTRNLEEGWTSSNSKLIMEFNTKNECKIWSLGNDDFEEKFDFLIDENKGVIKSINQDKNIYKIIKISSDELVLLDIEFQTKIFFIHSKIHISILM